MRIAALAALALLTGCASAPVLDAPTAINGHELDTALSLYGRWDERVFLDGRPHYIWRRAVVLGGKSYYCELRAETGYRNTIKASIVEGFPAACGLFSVQYTAMPIRKPEAIPAGPAPTVLASGCKTCRPVGGPRETAATGASRDASARPPAPRAGPDGS